MAQHNGTNGVHVNGNGTNGSDSHVRKMSRKASSPMMPAFMVSAPGKVIVFGEHAVVHGKVSSTARCAPAPSLQLVSDMLWYRLPLRLLSLCDHTSW